MWHKPCRTFHPWCLCIKTRCLLYYTDTGLSGLVSPVMPATKSRLDPLVLPFSPSAPLPIEEQLAGKPASPTLETVCPSPDLPPPSPLPALARAVDVPSPDGSATLDIDGHRVHSKFQVLDSGKPGCTNHSCMYGGGLGAIDHDYIYDCKQCFGLASSSICARCLIYGGTCEPDHNAWVLVTWKLFSWTADILLIYQRPTFHSWIPEWRTIFFFFFFFI